MMDEKKLELLKKLQALSDRGVGGEKENARQKLEQLMKKYQIEEIDLLEDKLEDHDFRYHNEYELTILRQLFYKIVPDFQLNTYRYRCGKGSRSTYGITCTKAQAIQIQIEYEFYRSLWKEEVDFFMQAFIQKHRIFAVEGKDESDDDGEEMSREDLLRMAAMIRGMKDKSIRSMLKGGIP